MKTTISKEKITMLTKKGMKELKKSISQLELDKHKMIQIIKELDKNLGRDERLSRIEKLSDLELIESELEEKRHILSCSRLLSNKRSQLRVALGSVVDLIDRHGKMFRFKIVESIEADPSDGRISTNSPIGKSLLGKTVADIVEWGSKDRINRLHLIRIN